MRITLHCPNDHEWEVEAEYDGGDPSVGIFEGIDMPSPDFPETICSECGYHVTQAELDKIAQDRVTDMHEPPDDDWRHE